MQDRSPTVSFAGHTRTPSTNTLLPKGNLESSISQSVFGLGRNQNMHGRKEKKQKKTCADRERNMHRHERPQASIQKQVTLHHRATVSYVYRLKFSISFTMSTEIAIHIKVGCVTLLWFSKYCWQVCFCLS